MKVGGSRDSTTPQRIHTPRGAGSTTRPSSTTPPREHTEQGPRRSAPAGIFPCRALRCSSTKHEHRARSSRSDAVPGARVRWPSDAGGAGNARRGASALCDSNPSLEEAHDRPGREALRSRRSRAARAQLPFRPRRLVLLVSTRHQRQRATQPDGENPQTPGSPFVDLLAGSPFLGEPTRGASAPQSVSPSRVFLGASACERRAARAHVAGRRTGGSCL